MIITDVFNNIPATKDRERTGESRARRKVYEENKFIGVYHGEESKLQIRMFMDSFALLYDIIGGRRKGSLDFEKEKHKKLFKQSEVFLLVL